ncbi:hypothetical protein [Methanotorris igneus]|nr:hypothetical protein [Methanotorris igneus]
MNLLCGFGNHSKEIKEILSLPKNEFLRYAKEIVLIILKNLKNKINS